MHASRFLTIFTALIWVLAFVLSSLLTMSMARADSVEPSQFEMPDLSSQRKAYLRAEKLVWKMDFEELQETINDLNGYPLTPYLVERKLSHKIRLQNEDLMRQFLSDYEGSPLARKLRSKWLNYLAKRKRASLFIEFYKPTSSATLNCAFIEFQMTQGLSLETVKDDIAELWTVGKSQPKQCDGIFKKWMKAGFLSEDLILLRIKKAADGGKHTLIPYLRTLLPDNKKYLADLWHKTRRDPSTVRRTKLFTSKYPLIEAEIMSYGLSRLIWRDTNLAIKTLEKAEKRITFTLEQRARIYGRFGIKLAIDDHPQAEKWLLKAAEVGDDSEAMRWHLALLLRKQDWAKLVLLIEKSAPQKVAAHDYSYWLARAYEQLGQSEKAQDLYQQLATQRHYYGFLASARINQPYSLQHAPVVVSKEAIAKTMSLDSSKRAYELRQLGRHHEARLEWRHTQSVLDDDEKLATTVIASAWQWHDQAIFTFSREGYLNDVERRFPTAFADIITREANKNDIEPEWAFAIARRESSFMTDAVSSANARGLMQVLPSTAKYLEKRRVSSKQLLNVETNAKIGNKYLRYLMDKLDNNVILATASYNAGWRRVRQWLPENEAIEADLWVELIPFKETRNYVKAVTAYKQIYRAQLNGEPFKVTSTAQVQKASQNNVFIDFIETDIPVSL
jgi:soluble lytic murein transglycosylase